MRNYTVEKAAAIITNRVESRLGRQRMISGPVNVDVVLTKACNLACSFCRDYEHEGSKKVSVENMERVAAELFSGAAWVNVCSGGEPYLHLGLEHLLRLAKEHNAKRWVLSNAMLLKKERMRDIIGEDLITSHGFSVDGIDAETVESIRVNSDLPTILRNINMVLRLRDEAHKSEPSIVIRFALMRRNIEQLSDAIRYWGERGVSRLDTGYLVLANGIEHDESLYFHQDLMQREFEKARKVAEGFPELEVRLPPTVEEDRPKATNPAPCRSAWDFVMIDTSGTVLPCYRAFEALQMGNIYGPDAQPFAEIWNGSAYRALRRTVNKAAAGESTPEGGYGYCHVCENRFGWSALEVHLGDETWQRAAFDDANAGAQIDHRRRGFKGLAPIHGADDARTE